MFKNFLCAKIFIKKQCFKIQTLTISFLSSESTEETTVGTEIPKASKEGLEITLSQTG